MNLNQRNRIYNIWRLMVGRCHNPNWNNYFVKNIIRTKEYVFVIRGEKTFSLLWTGPLKMVIVTDVA